MERAIQYVRHGFFAARTWSDVADLNRQSQAWCETEAAERRCPGDRSLFVAQAFEKERPLLLPVPDHPFPADDRVEVSVRKQPYVTFDRNQYSVPHDRVRRTLVVLASEDTVRVLDGTTEVARHPRSYDRSARIENPKHIEALEASKREARESRGMDRLHRACPISEQLLIAVAERGGNVGSATSRLLYLLEAYGPVDLEACIRRALAAGASHVAAVEQCLDQLRQDRRQPPPLPLNLPPGVQNVVVKPHSLDGYDPKETQDDDDNAA